MMHKPRIALIHATPVAVEPINAAFRRLWPEAAVTNLLEDSLAPDVARDGRITPNMKERFVTLARYVRGCGAEGIMFTCSAFGTAIEAARAALDIPVLKRVGLAGAPADAAAEVREVVDWVSTQGGGRGAVREFIELVLRARGQWDAIVKDFSA